MAHVDAIDAMGAQPRALAGIERAGAEQMDVLRPHRIERPVLAEDRRQHRIAREKGQRHAVQIAGRRGLGRVVVGMGIEPQHRELLPALGAAPRDPADAAHGNRMVAADEDRHAARVGRRHRMGAVMDPPGPAGDLGEMLAGCGRLCRHRHLDRPGLAQGAAIGHPVPERRQHARQSSGPQRIGPHQRAARRRADFEADPEKRDILPAELGQQSGGLQSLEQRALPLVARSSIYGPSLRADR